MIWVLTKALDDSFPFSDEREKNLMNFGPKSKKLYHHLLLQDWTSEEEPMNNTLVIGLLMVATFASLWGMFYARRSYQNTKKIMDKVGH